INRQIAATILELSDVTILIHCPKRNTLLEISKRLPKLENALLSLTHSIKHFARRSAIRLRVARRAAIGVEST
ncbi:hypothetical protein, partial [Burkholderia sp. SIMBA_052]|uniref:hypothetical protein n=1 Tax=Burkholderia sp. SIMBA_052 TaxID=3085793 RepID=UPI00397B023C